MCFELIRIAIVQFVRVRIVINLLFLSFSFQDALRLYLVNSPVVRAESLRFKRIGVFGVVSVFLQYVSVFVKSIFCDLTGFDLIR
jgi:hypothetical protein